MLERLQQGIDTQERCGYLIIEVRGGETDSRECRLTCKGSTFLSLGFAFIILYRLVVKDPAVIGENDAFYLGMFMYIGLLSGVHWWTTDALRNLPGRPGSEQQWCLSCVNGVNIFAASALCMATITYMIFPPDVNGVVFGIFALTGTLSAGYAVYRSVTVMYLVERLKKAPPAGYHELNAYSLLVEVPTPTVSTPGVRRKLVQ